MDFLELLRNADDGVGSLGKCELFCEEEKKVARSALSYVIAKTDQLTADTISRSTVEGQIFLQRVSPHEPEQQNWMDTTQAAFSVFHRSGRNSPASSPQRSFRWCRAATSNCT